MGRVLEHWVEKLASRVVKARKPPFVVGSGITTSGPAHLGTVCEFLYPWFLVRELNEMGYDTYFIFVGDIMDAFDSIPAQLADYRDLLEPHLGRPLAFVPDVYGCHSSYGEHFLDEVRKLMKIFGVKPDEVHSAHKLYEEGYYYHYAIMFMERIDEVRRLLEEVSGRRLRKDWMDIVLLVCPQCGKIATTRVTYLDPSRDLVGIKCDKDVGYTKGCGFEGEVELEPGKWKLTWRLDWPSRMDFLGVDVEGAGVDHHTRGGSWDTAVAVFKRLFGKEPPVGFKYGFVLFRGRKMSKSKGVGGLQRILELVPPVVLKYFLLKHELEENKNFDDRPEYLLRLIDEFERVADVFEERGVEGVGRRLYRKVIAYKLSTDGVRPWRTRFSDVLVYYQIYGDWKRVVERLDEEEGVSKLAPYVERWVREGLVPERYRVALNPTKVDDPKGLLRRFALSLREGMTPIEIHNLVYEVARGMGERPEELFRMAYMALLGKPHGPRLGKLVYALGVSRAKEILLSSCQP